MSRLPFAMRGIDHVVLRVRDFERSLGFYVGVLGCVPTWRREGLGLVHLRAGAGTMIDLVSLDGSLGLKGGRGPEREGRNVDHLCLQVAPFDASAIGAHLAAHGIEFDKVAPRNFGAEGAGPSLYLEDPDGNTIELKGPPLQAIDLAVELAAPPATVWRWLTEPELTQRYWGGTRIESTWRPGDSILYRRAGEITDEHVILEIEAPRLLVHSFHPVLGEFRNEAPSRVRILLQDAPRGTRLALRHDGFPADSLVYPACAQGWPEILEALRAALDS